jgi:hypothetical protein
MAGASPAMRIFIARIKQTPENEKDFDSTGFFDLSMSARQNGPYDSIARKWLALAERRRAHLIELRENGRWERYYTDAQLADQLDELDIACDRLVKLAGAAA